MEEIRQKLRAFIIENFLFGRSDEELHDDDSLIERGIIDSTGVLLLVCFLEQDLKLAVQDDEIVPGNLDSLDRLAAFASRKLGLEDYGTVSSAPLETVFTSDAEAV